MCFLINMRLLASWLACMTVASLSVREAREIHSHKSIDISWLADLDYNETQVRVRSAGEGGSGHSEWSKPGVIAIPESQQREPQPSSRMTGSSRSASSYSLDREAPASSTERVGASGAIEGDDTKRKPSKLAGTNPLPRASQLCERSPTFLTQQSVGGKLCSCSYKM